MGPGPVHPKPLARRLPRGVGPSNGSKERQLAATIRCAAPGEGVRPHAASYLAGVDGPANPVISTTSNLKRKSLSDPHRSLNFVYGNISVQRATNFDAMVRKLT